MAERVTADHQVSSSTLDAPSFYHFLMPSSMNIMSFVVISPSRFIVGYVVGTDSRITMNVDDCKKKCFSDIDETDPE